MARKKKATETTINETQNNFKYGYYKADFCFMVTYEKVEYHIYGDDFTYSYYDQATGKYIEITDKDELFKIWFNNRMGGKYIEKNEDLLNKLIRINSNAEFIGVE